MGLFHASTVFNRRRCNFALTNFKNWRRMERWWFIFMELFVHLKGICEVWCIVRQKCGLYFKGRIPEVTSYATIVLVTILNLSIWLSKSGNLFKSPQVQAVWLHIFMIHNRHSHRIVCISRWQMWWLYFKWRILEVSREFS